MSQNDPVLCHSALIVLPVGQFCLASEKFVLDFVFHAILVSLNRELAQKISSITSTVIDDDESVDNDDDDDDNDDDNDNKQRR